MGTITIRVWALLCKETCQGGREGEEAATALICHLRPDTKA